MADKVNECHAFINQMLRDEPNGKKLAKELALKDWAIEQQVGEDIRQIGQHINEALNVLTPHNIEYTKMKIQAILICAMKEFDQRKEHAEEVYEYTLSNEN